MKIEKLDWIYTYVYIKYMEKSSLLLALLTLPTLYIITRWSQDIINFQRFQPIITAVLFKRTKWIIDYAQY